MKKILSITIALCLVFASVLPVYAEAWTSEQAYQTNQSARSLVSLVTNIYSLLQTNFGASGDLALMGENIAKLVSWLTPEGYKPSDYHSLWEICLDIGTALYQYLPHIPTIAGYVGSWMTSNNNYLNALNVVLTNIGFNKGGASAYSWEQLCKNGHGMLFTGTIGQPMNGAYLFRQLRPDGLSENPSNNLQWQYGSPIGNLALEFQRYNNNFVYGYLSMSNRMLTDYTGQLGIWDSQGETLTQEAWSPTSAINGLYKYLAYTQRDVARLTYVLASDEEIATREKARETQTAIMDDFIDPEGTAAASTDNFGEIASGSENVKQNFSTGYSVSNMWGAFGSEHYGWFSQECADALDTSAASNSRNRLLKNDKHDESDYDTPLLDEYYRQILSLGGGNVD